MASRYFHRQFTLADVPRACRIRITCDNGYALFVNGREIGRGDSWMRIQEYDAKSALQSGTNVIAVDARNEGGQGALVAEIWLQQADGSVARIGTDATWLSASALPTGWPALGLADSAWMPARVISTFDESLWAKHEQGPPRLDAPVGDPTTMPWNADLAMRWYRDTTRLPFDTRPEAREPAGWYRFVSPPGLRSLVMPTAQPVRTWVDGKELPVRSEAGLATVQVSQPSPRPVVVALRVEQQRGDYGGAAFTDFIRLECDAGELSPGDWSKAGVLETYSGGAWYRRTVPLTAQQANGVVMLDLGQVAASAEVLVNGKPAGIKVAPPWRLELSSLLTAGDNRIEILVCNTLANHYVTIPTHYRGSTVSGLLGPVRLEITR